MGDRRQDRLTGEWVIIAPDRHLRPHASLHRSPKPETPPAFDPSCPFCPGNERLLAEIIKEVPADHPPGWATRVVANKYPIVEISNGKDAAAAHGHHQVIIETPRHDVDLAEASLADLKAVIEAYREREIALGELPGTRAVISFRNHGRSAGASLAHPHSQVIALGWLPPRLQAVKRRAIAFHRRSGRCLLCDILGEAASSERLIAENKGFAAFIPFAAMAPFETWIAPKRHDSRFSAMNSGEIRDFAALLQGILAALKTALDDPPYNYAIETFLDTGSAASALHWRLRLVPNMAAPAGFELGAGLTVNPSSPEADGAVLRSARPST